MDDMYNSYKYVFILNIMKICKHRKCETKQNDTEASDTKQDA